MMQGLGRTAGFLESGMSEKLNKIYESEQLDKPEPSPANERQANNESPSYLREPAENEAKHSGERSLTRSREDKDFATPESGISLGLWRLAERLVSAQNFEGTPESDLENSGTREKVGGMIARIELIVSRVVRTVLLSALRLLLIKYSEAFEALMNHGNNR